MNLFKVLSLLSLLFSSNLFAGGPVENESVQPPRVLRGVKVVGEEHVDIISADSSRVLPRIIEGKFGFVSSSMDWTIYRFQKAYGIFWTEGATQILKASKTIGINVEINPDLEGFCLSEENLNRITVKAGNRTITLWDALLKYNIDGDGILVITQ